MGFWAIPTLVTASGRDKPDGAQAPGGHAHSGAKARRPGALGGSRGPGRVGASGRAGRRGDRAGNRADAHRAGSGSGSGSASGREDAAQDDYYRRSQSHARETA
jgi:hypothetical protein